MPGSPAADGLRSSGRRSPVVGGPGPSAARHRPSPEHAVPACLSWCPRASPRSSRRQFHEGPSRGSRGRGRGDCRHRPRAALAGEDGPRGHQPRAGRGGAPAAASARQVRRRAHRRQRPRRHRGPGPRARRRPRPERRRAALQRGDLRRRVRGRLQLHGHGDDPVQPAPRATLRAAGRQARRLPVRARRAVGGEGPAGPRRHGRGAGHGRRLRPLRREAPVRPHRRDRHPRRGQPGGPRLRLRAQLLDLDDDRGVPEPAGDLGGATAAGTRRSRSPSPRSSTSPRASAPSSASTSSTRRCSSSRAG